MGGKKLTCNGPVSTPTSYLTTSKFHWNSIMSTPRSKYMVATVDNFYLDNPMLKHEYYKIALILIPKFIINHYYLMEKKIDRYISIRVYKGGCILLQ